MYSRERIDTIRKMKSVRLKGEAERPRHIYGGSSTSNFIETRQTHCSLETPFLSKDDSEPRKTSFFIEWNKDEGQFKIVSDKTV